MLFDERLMIGFCHCEVIEILDIRCEVSRGRFCSEGSFRRSSMQQTNVIVFTVILMKEGARLNANEYFFWHFC